jgi:hypothetical protein
MSTKYVFNFWSAFVLMIFFIYVGYAFPLLNEEKSAQMWGTQDKWDWYALFCLEHFLFSLIPIFLGAGIFFVVDRFFPRN